MEFRRVLFRSDLDRGILLLDRAEVGVGADGGRGRDDADPSVARRQRGRCGTGSDHPQDRDVVSAAQVAQGDGRRGVAGDDHRLDVPLDQRIDRFGREGTDLVVRAGAVGGATVVSQVDRRFAGQPPDDLPEHRQAADPRVEHADRPRVCHAPAGPYCLAPTGTRAAAISSVATRLTSWLIAAPGLAITNGTPSLLLWTTSLPSDTTVCSGTRP